MASANDEPERHEEIGRGGFGIVYRGKYKEHKQVAIKVLNISNSKEVQNEIRLLQTLKHRNIIYLIDALVRPSQTLIITEYIRHGNLHDYIVERAHHWRPYWIKIRKIITGVTAGLIYLRDSKIVHGDLKSMNILLRDGDEGVICDFGLARTISISQSLHTSKVAGISSKYFF